MCETHASIKMYIRKGSNIRVNKLVYKCLMYVNRLFYLHTISIIHLLIYLSNVVFITLIYKQYTRTKNVSYCDI